MPAGIGKDTPSTVKVNFRKQNTIKLNTTEGVFHIGFSLKGVLLNIWFKIVLSPGLMKGILKVHKLVIRATEKQSFHLFEMNGIFILVLR